MLSNQYIFQKDCLYKKLFWSRKKGKKNSMKIQINCCFQFDQIFNFCDIVLMLIISYYRVYLLIHVKSYFKQVNFAFRLFFYCFCLVWDIDIKSYNVKTFSKFSCLKLINVSYGKISSFTKFLIFFSRYIFIVLFLPPKYLYVRLYNQIINASVTLKFLRYSSMYKIYPYLSY